MGAEAAGRGTVPTSATEAEKEGAETQGPVVLSLETSQGLAAIVTLALYVALGMIRWAADSAHFGLLATLGIAVLMGLDLLVERQIECQYGGAALATGLSISDVVVWLQTPSSAQQAQAAKKAGVTQADVPLSPV